MFCILITATLLTAPPKCVGSYATFERCDAAVANIARNVTPETHTGVSFRCVEQGRRL
jgi:hypothetical protein